MKNQYVGDVNDYRKYSLLEVISESLNEKILVAWMLTEDDGRTDGNKLEYLKNEKNRRLNPELFDKLKAIDMNKRAIDAVEKVLGNKYTFHSEVLSDNKADREKYFEAVLKKAKDVGLVFFDPDNGIEVQTPKIGNKDSSKFLYWNEIQKTVEAGKDVLIYQHFPREKRETYIERLKNELHDKTKLDVLPIETANVLFLLATKQGNKLNEIKAKWEERNNN